MFLRRNTAIRIVERRKECRKRPARKALKKLFVVVCVFSTDGYDAAMFVSILGSLVSLSLAGDS